MPGLFDDLVPDERLAAEDAAPPALPVRPAGLLDDLVPDAPEADPTVYVHPSLYDDEALLAHALGERPLPSREAVVQAIADRQPASAIVAPVHGGVALAGSDLTALGQRIIGEDAAADRTKREAALYAAGVERAATEMGAPPTLARGVQGATRSLITAALASPAGAAGMIAAPMVMEGNEGITEARDAGLQGMEVAGHATRAAAIEGLLAAIMQRVGLGGFESQAPVFGAGLRDGLKEIAKRTGHELALEELPTELLHAINRKVGGIDPEALTPEALYALTRDTTVQTLLTMGAAGATDAGNVAAGRVQQARAERAELEQAAGAAAARLGSPEMAGEMVVDPSRPAETLPVDDPAAGPGPRHVGAREIAAAQVQDEFRRAYPLSRPDTGAPPAEDRQAEIAAAVERLTAEEARVLRGLLATDGLPEPAPPITEAVGNESGQPPEVESRQDDINPRNNLAPKAVPDLAERARFARTQEARQAIEAEYREALEAIEAQRAGGAIGKPQAASLRQAAAAERQRRYGVAMEAIADDQPVPTSPRLREALRIQPQEPSRGPADQGAPPAAGAGERPAVGAPAPAADPLATGGDQPAGDAGAPAGDRVAAGAGAPRSWSLDALTPEDRTELADALEGGLGAVDEVGGIRPTQRTIGDMGMPFRYRKRLGTSPWLEEFTKAGGSTSAVQGAAKALREGRAPRGAAGEFLRRRGQAILEEARRDRDASADIVEREAIQEEAAPETQGGPSKREAAAPWDDVPFARIRRLGREPSAGGDAQASPERVPGEAERSLVDGGPLLRQHRHDAKGAVAALRKQRSGEAIAALHHPELGDIDLVYGEPGQDDDTGYGLAKLEAHHPEVVENLQEIVGRLPVVRRTANRIQLDDGTYRAAVRLEWNGTAKTWLLTAFTKKGAPAGRTTGAASSEAPGRLPQSTGTAEPTPPTSEGKDRQGDAVRPEEPGDGVQATVQRTLDRYQVALGRLPVAPLPGGSADRKLPDIIRDAGEWLGAQVRRAKTPRGAGGYYDPKSGGLIIRQSGDLDVAAHELAHWTDDANGLLADFQSADLPDGSGALNPVVERRASLFDGELVKFWPFGSSPRLGMTEAQAQNYRRAEGMAEYLRAWMFNPEATERAAPLLTAHVQALLPEDVRAKLRDFGDEVRRWAGLPAEERGKANIRDLGDTGPGPLETFSRGVKDLMAGADGFRVTAWDRLKAETLDALAPVIKGIRFAKGERARLGGDPELPPERDPEVLIRLLGGIYDKQQAIIDRGMVDARLERAEGVEGGIDWLTGWVDARSKATVAKDLADLGHYMVNQRVVERAAQLDATVAESLAKRAQEIAAAYAAEQNAADAAEAANRARLARQSRRTGKAVDAVGDVQERAEGTIAKGDKDLARVDELAEGSRKAVGDRISTAREALAKRGDALAKDLVAVLERVDQAQQGLGEDLAKDVERLRETARKRYTARMMILARGSARMRRAAEAIKGRLAGTGGGVFSDTEQAQEALAAIASDPVRHARMEEGAKRYRAWADAVLRYAVEKGRLAPDHYEAIKAKNEYYVAMHRAAEEGLDGLRSTGRRIGSPKDPVKAFKGSTRFLENPFANLLDQTAKVLYEADRNEALRSFVDLLEVRRGMHSGEQPLLAGIGQKVREGTKDAIAVFRDGQAEHWLFEEHVLKALKGWGQVTKLGPFLNALTIPGRVLRNLIVNTPPFAIRNRIRDSISRLIVSQVRDGGLAGAARRLRQQLPGLSGQTDQDRALAMMAGGAFAGHYLSGPKDWHRELAKRTKELAQDRSVVITSLAKAGGAYGRWIRGSELRGRVDEFNAAYREARGKGLDEYNARLIAALRSRQLIDFAVAGNAIRVINQFVPFLNASIQGLAAEARAVGRAPGRTAARWGAYALAPSLACYLLAAMGGKDEEEEYRNLPAWRRDFFWNIKVAAGIWLSIPKPFTYGVAAASAERAVDATVLMVRDGKSASEATAQAFEGHAGSLARALLPVDDAALVGPLKTEVEIALNRSTFTNRDIVPHYERELPVEQRKGTKNASGLGQVGQWITGADARVVDHLIRGHLGIAGSLAMQASDLPREDRPGAAKRLGQSLVGIVREGAGSDQADVQRFLAEEKREGRPQGKPAQQIGEMSRSYWQARSGTEREALAKAMRDYANGVDPLMVFDRATSAANQLQAALERLEGPARQQFAAANATVLGRARALDRASQRVAKAKRAGMSREEVGKLARQFLDGINQSFPEVAKADD